MPPETPVAVTALYEPHKSQPSLLTPGKRLSSGLQWYPPPRRLYTRRELLADRIVNFTGACLTWVACPVMLYVSWAAGNSAVKQFGFWVHAIGLVVMMNCSAFYHLWSWNWKNADRLLIIDHLGINAMIMGCYTPPMVHCNCFRTLIFVIVLGTLGWLIKAWELSAEKNDVQSNSGSSPSSWCIYLHEVRYLAMGWACVPVMPIMWTDLPPQGLTLILAGGVMYTVGVVFFLWEDLEYHLPIWHVLVLVASSIFYYLYYQLIFAA